MTVALVANVARPISSAISTAFSADSYGALSSYGLLSGSAVVDPDAVIEALFANSEQGAWYDPSDLSTMFQDHAGTTPVTADGQTVGKILDKSGRGNHAVAPSDAARPLYKTSGGKSWLEFDGVDDSLSTSAINFSSTNKMSIWTGVRKNSDATSGMLYELSANAVTNSGTFHARAPDAAAPNYETLANGTSYIYSVCVTYTAPIINVLTSLIDLVAATALVQNTTRINAIDVSTNTGGTTTGGGTFGNWPLYIGSRSGPSISFNGRIYSLIVRGALSTTQQITDTETWVNSKTGAY